MWLPNVSGDVNFIQKLLTLKDKYIENPTCLNSFYLPFPKFTIAALLGDSSHLLGYIIYKLCHILQSLICLLRSVCPILGSVWYLYQPVHSQYILYLCLISAKVLCILHHRGVQLILAYSWARPAILVVGKGRGGMFFISSVSSLSFLFLFLPCPSLSSPLLSLLSLFSLSLGDDTKWPSRVDMSLNPNTIKIHWT